MKTISTLTLCLLCMYCNSQTTLTYSASTADIQNPGRGFYSHRETDANASGVMLNPLTLSDIQAQRSTKNITLIFRLYYLSQFKSSAISASYLASIQNDLNIIRQAGAKAIIRFAYNSTEQTHRHSLDASKSWVLTHIGQLKSTLINNSDVILVLQSGFIGTWGEWYYTHPDFTLATPAGSPNYPNRKEVSDSLLKVLPLGKMIQLRTSYYKYNAGMYGTGASGTASALTAAQAYNGSSQSRIGHHNDCFLASSSDYGTYIDVVEDKNYLEQDTKYTFNGGEVCNNDITYTNCTNAQAELARFHYSYLNNDYNATVLNQWVTDGCFTTIKQKLGYRLELLDGTYTNTGSQSYSYSVNINLRNVGYAPPYEQKNVQLILKNNSTSTEYAVSLNTIDNRFWLPGSVYNINTTVGIGNIPNGTYNLYLALKDTGSTIASNPNYAIQFANTGTWEATKGYNLLKTITVTSGTNPGTATYAGSLWFGTPIAVPIHLRDFNFRSVDRGTEIYWTMNENNEYSKYEVERSENGIDFNTIGERKSLSNSGINKYDFLDAAVLNANIIYYRIKIISKNGTFEYSPVLRVRKTGNALSVLTVYPTPTTGVMNIELNNTVKGIVTIEVVDVNGIILKKASYMTSIGYNVINSVSIADLPSGVYVLKIGNGTAAAYHKIVKQ